MVSTSISYSDPGISTDVFFRMIRSPSSIFTRRIPFTQSFSSTRPLFAGQKVKMIPFLFGVMNFLCTGRQLSFHMIG